MQIKSTHQGPSQLSKINRHTTESQSPKSPSLVPQDKVAFSGARKHGVARVILGAAAGAMAGGALGSVSPSAIAGGAGLATAVGVTSAALGGFAGYVQGAKHSGSIGWGKAAEAALGAAVGAGISGVVGGIAGGVLGAHAPVLGMAIGGAIVGGVLAHKSQ